MLVGEEKVKGALLPIGATKSAAFKANIARLGVANFCSPMNRGDITAGTTLRYGENTLK
ncbi:hypothetical protein [Coxiella endosymbiont of Ornithodoros maritimus]|uniref:hypothetical protein n=1 Tax=Coxiella endosymbiont of Ornithodoros maritimus TaxID=1656172 RepID=UPI0022643AB3|nr:hypothetical protein [Coxiella endosymbiont of Ornithodoros maritimus]